MDKNNSRDTVDVKKPKTKRDCSNFFFVIKIQKP